MLVIFLILIVLVSLILGAIILVQNPKGGGLSGVIGGFSNQLIGVKQSTDVFEKGTWILAGIVAFLCITAPFFTPKATGVSAEGEKYYNTNGTAPSRSKQPSVPFNAGSNDTPASRQR